MTSDLNTHQSADTEKVVGTMCLLRARYPASLKTIRSLEGQIDTLYLCLNDFWEVPPELQQDWIEILHLGMNLGDAARFYLLRNMSSVDAHVLSCDDDWEYPKSYVQDFLTAHRKYPNAVLTHHGIIKHYRGNEKFRYIDAVKPDSSPCALYPDVRYAAGLSLYHKQQNFIRLDKCGSGVSFIPKSIFNQLEFNSLVYLNMADIHLACNYQKLNIPIIGMPHAKDYFRNISSSGPTIYDTVTAKPDWMEKVYKIHDSYGLSATRR